MFSVLVVDDEPRHRRGIVNIIQKIRTDFRIYEAINGLEALNFVQRNAVQIVITDIRMPIMDGLEFLGKMQLYRENVKIIIISAYRDFDYMKKALHLQAVDYILKPVTVEAVEATLQQVEAKLTREIEQQNQTNALISRLDYTQPIYIEHQMNKWVEGTLSEDEWEQFYLFFELKGPGTVLFLELDFQEIHRLEAVDVRGQIALKLNLLGKCLSFNSKNRNSIVAILRTNDHFGESWMPRLSDRLNTLIEEIHKLWGIKMTIGLGMFCEDLSMVGLKAYTEAILAIQNRFFYGSGKVYLYNDSGIEWVQPEELAVCMNKLSLQLEKHLKEADLQAIQLVFRTFCDELFLKGRLSPQETKAAFAKLLLDQFIWLQHVFEEDWQPDIIYSLSHAGTLTELKERTETWLVNIVQRLDKKKKHKLEPVMQACKDYIMEHYSEDLSLDVIAKQFHFNSSYFSEQFKQYKGINFSDYLLQVRMDSAKQMLETTHEKIYQIAFDVGYKDAKYFNRLFKRETGITPEQYRQIRQNKQMDYHEGGIK